MIRRINRMVARAATTYHLVGNRARRLLRVGRVTVGEAVEASGHL